MKILIIPDIHGRTFWKEPCADISAYDKVVFLGDYLDPYQPEGITRNAAIENFKDIISFASNNADKVILLLGNHDMHYISREFLKSSGGSRYDSSHARKISGLFAMNIDLFHIVYETDKTIFTHAGIHKQWLNINNLEVSKLDDLKFHTEPLNNVSSVRGGDYECGSCVWADISEYEAPDGQYINDLDKYQIFGHTMQLDIDEYYKGNWVFTVPIFSNKLSMLDNGQAYVYDEEAKTIISYDSDKIETKYIYIIH